MIELDGKTAGAAAVKGGLDQVDKAAQKADHSLSQLGKESFGHGMVGKIFTAQAAFEALKTGAGLALRAIKMEANSIKEAIEAAASGERLRSVFHNMLGDDSGKTLEYIDKWSKKTEFAQSEARGFGAELLRVGYSGNKFHDAMAAIADSASLSTNRLEGAQEATSSLVRMQRTGKIDSRSLAGLHLDARDVAKGLGDALGMSPEAVKKGLEEGTIPAAAAFNAVLNEIEKKTHKKLGEAGLGMREGLDASIIHLKEVHGKLLDTLADSPGVKFLQQGIDSLVEALDPKGETGKMLMQGTSDLIAGIGKAFKDVDWKGVAVDVKELLDDLTALVKPLKWIASAIASIPSAGRWFGDQLAGADAKEQKREFENMMKNQKHHVAFAGEESDHDKMMREASERGKQQARDEWLAAHPGEELPTSNTYHPVGPYDTGGAYAQPAGPWREELPKLPAGDTRHGRGNVHIDGARADVHVHVQGSKASPDEIAHAAKTGTHAGLTHAMEQQAAMAGVGR
jgi:hypothetical protein